MYHECFFCNHSFEDYAIAKGYVHIIGKYLICQSCLAELRDALEADIAKKVEEDVEAVEQTKNVFLI